MFSYRLRRGGIRQSLTLSSSRFQSAISIQLKTEALPPKEEMIDSSNKEYKCMQISGFTVYYEAGLFEYNPAFHIALVDDLEKVIKCLLITVSTDEVNLFFFGIL